MIKNYLKSISLGNLATIDDNSIDVEETPLSAHSHSRGDKHNLSSANDQKKELLQKLKEFSNLSNHIALPHYYPENNFVVPQGSVSKEIYQQQSAIWELVVTEQNFLKQIHFIVEVYISTFESLAKDFFPKINVTDIFSNLKEVYRVSLEFWKECMDPMLKEANISNYYFESQLLKNGFIKIGMILEPYILYCTEISTCRSYILSLEKGNELFSEYTKWAMEFEESNREMLCDHLAKPFQRLTKYKILLQAIYKHSSSNEKADIQEMIEAVDIFVTKVNEKVEEKTLTRKLLHLSNQIDTYDVIEPLGDDLLPIINQFNRFDLNAPITIGSLKIIRQLIHQGEMKLREGPSKTVDVKLYLLTDILLITKSKKKTFGKMKIIRPPIILDKTRFQRITNNSFVCICLNEFNCISSLYHLSYSDTKKVDEWLQKLEETSKHYLYLKPLPTDINLFREYQNSIPKVNILQSSPRRNKFKTESLIDTVPNESNMECSFKRKSPVARKHKNKKDTTLYGVEVTFESPPLLRKISQPSLNPLDMRINRRLSKSNSFHERDKQISDSSDVDDSIPIRNSATSTLSLNKFNEESTLFREISDDFITVKPKSINMNKYQTEPSAKMVETMKKTFSKSLNKLNY